MTQTAFKAYKNYRSADDYKTYKNKISKVKTKRLIVEDAFTGQSRAATKEEIAATQVSVMPSENQEAVKPIFGTNVYRYTEETGEKEVVATFKPRATARRSANKIIAEDSFNMQSRAATKEEIAATQVSVMPSKNQEAATPIYGTNLYRYNGKDKELIGTAKAKPKNFTPAFYQPTQTELDAAKTGYRYNNKAARATRYLLNEYIIPPARGFKGAVLESEKGIAQTFKFYDLQKKALINTQYGRLTGLEQLQIEQIKGEYKTTQYKDLTALGTIGVLSILPTSAFYTVAAGATAYTGYRAYKEPTTERFVDLGVSASPFLIQGGKALKEAPSVFPQLLNSKSTTKGMNLFSKQAGFIKISKELNNIGKGKTEFIENFRVKPTGRAVSRQYYEPFKFKDVQVNPKETFIIGQGETPIVSILDVAGEGLVTRTVTLKSNPRIRTRYNKQVGQETVIQENIAQNIIFETRTFTPEPRRLFNLDASKPVTGFMTPYKSLTRQGRVSVTRQDFSLTTDEGVFTGFLGATTVQKAQLIKPFREFDYGVSVKANGEFTNPVTSRRKIQTEIQFGKPKKSRDVINTEIIGLKQTGFRNEAPNVFLTTEVTNKKLGSILQGTENRNLGEYAPDKDAIIISSDFNKAFNYVDRKRKLGQPLKNTRVLRTVLGTDAYIYSPLKAKTIMPEFNIKEIDIISYSNIGSSKQYDAVQSSILREGQSTFRHEYLHKRFPQATEAAVRTGERLFIDFKRPTYEANIIRTNALQVARAKNIVTTTPAGSFIFTNKPAVLRFRQIQGERPSIINTGRKMLASKRAEIGSGRQGLISKQLPQTETIYIPIAKTAELKGLETQLGGLKDIMKASFKSRRSARNRFNLDSNTLQRNIQRQNPINNIMQTPTQNIIPAQRIQPIQKQTPVQRLVQTPVQRQISNVSVTQRFNISQSISTAAFKQPYTSSVLGKTTSTPPLMPPLNLNIKKDSTGKKQKKAAKANRNYSYTPSVTALAFNIRSNSFSQTKARTGIFIRPILTRG